MEKISIEIIKDKQNHLSDEDKKVIKEVILYRAKYGSFTHGIRELCEALYESFILINSGSGPVVTHQNHQD